MCGIAGGWWKGSRQADTQLPRALEKMKTRGPDDSGHELYAAGSAAVALGHTRLSIFDLSSAGHQPMLSPDKRFSLIFNGEIYNYRELRTELEGLGCRFVSNSDTEVLLAAWMQWGRSCLVRLTGMFAFAVLDRAANTLVCVRDAFGIKPFFYAELADGFRFASEMPALIEILPGKPSLDWQCAYDYLVHGEYDCNTGSFYEGVRHLQPGHLLCVDLTSGRVSGLERWWSPCIEPRTDLSFADAVEQVRERFLASIRLHLRSDVALGAALSGGVDSSAVVCAMRHLEPDLPINTFSYIASDSDVNEEAWVDRVNGHIGAIAHKVSVSADELARDIDSMILAQGEPFGSTSIYAQYRVFQLARETGITVTLDGQGADEMLAGYNGYPGQRLRSLVETGHFKDAWQFLNGWSNWPGRSRLGGVKRLVAQMTQGSLHQTLRKANGMDAVPAWINEQPLRDKGVLTLFPHFRGRTDESGRRVVAELARSLTQRGLPALLRHGDRNSMHFSVESRVPFLTTGMVDLLLSLPEEYLISPEGETKHVFRAAMRGIVPDDVLDRRDKIGFATPEQAWLLSMADTVRSWLSIDLQLPFLDQKMVLQEFDLIVAGKKQFSWQVWRWVNFCRWYNHFIA